MKRRVLFLPISDRLGASGRYRVYQYESLLKEAGFNVRILPPAPRGQGAVRMVKRWNEERRLLQEVHRADIIFIQKRLFSVGFIDHLAHLGKPLVFDFDDAIFRSARGDWSALTRRRVTSRLTRVLKEASLVLAGNSYLADFARNHARRVEILPTVVDINRYRLKKHTETGRCILGWIGGQATQEYLNLIRDTLRELAGEITNLRLMVISDVDYELPGVKVECRRWSEETEVEDLLAIDMGLMPLEDNTWTRGKCALKALQYMAAGLPTICSAVGAARDVIKNRVDGFLCASDEEWKVVIKRLAADSTLREEIGRKARTKVEQAYSMDRTGKMLMYLLESV